MTPPEEITMQQVTNEQFLLRSRSDEEMPNMTLNSKLARIMKRETTTKNEAWQRGWAEAQE
jgi:hypothetical protein